MYGGIISGLPELFTLDRHVDLGYGRLKLVQRMLMLQRRQIIGLIFTLLLLEGVDQDGVVVEGKRLRFIDLNLHHVVMTGLKQRLFRFFGEFVESVSLWLIFFCGVTFHDFFRNLTRSASCNNPLLLLSYRRPISTLPNTFDKGTLRVTRLQGDRRR